MSSATGLNKNLFIFCKSTGFGHHQLPRSNFRGDFLNLVAKTWRNLKVAENVVRNSEFFNSTGVRVLQVDIFTKSPILGSCISAVRPFVLCFACFFHPLFDIFWTSSSSVVFLTAIRWLIVKKTAIFDEVRVVYAFSNNFLPICPKWENIIVISPFPRRYSV